MLFLRASTYLFSGLLCWGRVAGVSQGLRVFFGSSMQHSGLPSSQSFQTPDAVVLPSYPVSGPGPGPGPRSQEYWTPLCLKMQTHIPHPVCPSQDSTGLFCLHSIPTVQSCFWPAPTSDILLTNCYLVEALLPNEIVFRPSLLQI